MNKNKYIVLLSAVIFVSSVFILYKNSYNDQRNVYIALFKQFQSSTNLEKVAFSSVVSTCNAQPSHFKEASELLFNSFYTANNIKEKSTDFSIYSSLINVIKNPVPEINTKVNLQHDLISVSRIGFNIKKTEALVCAQSTRAEHLYFFKKIDNKWGIFKLKVIGIS